MYGNDKDILKGASKSWSNISAIKIELSIEILYEGDKIYEYYFEKMEEFGFQLWDLESGHRNLTTGKLMQFDAIFFNKFKHEKNLKILETNPHGSWIYLYIS